MQNRKYNKTRHAYIPSGSSLMHSLGQVYVLKILATFVPVLCLEDTCIKPGT